MLASSANGVGAGRQRPALHFVPPHGWMNDPNGLVVVDGRYHLYYQHNPDAPEWGNIHWGHAWSEDLLEWHHEPIALAPDELGMVFSGSAVRDDEGVSGFPPGSVVAMFTYDRDGLQTQALAHSSDGGTTWEKFDANPVLAPEPPPGHFRDPKLIRYTAADGVQWWVSLITADRDIQVFTSPDLKDWSLASTLTPHIDETDYMVEVPELVRLPSDDGTEVWTLFVSVTIFGPDKRTRRPVVWSAGTFDGRTFTPEGTDALPTYLPKSDGYALQVWEHAESPTAILWMDESDTQPVTGFDWCGRMSLPQRLRLAGPPGDRRLIGTAVAFDHLLNSGDPIPMQPPDSVRLVDRSPRSSLLVRRSSSERPETAILLRPADGSGRRVAVHLNGTEATVSVVEGGQQRRIDSIDLGGWDEAQVLLDAGSLDLLVDDRVVRYSAVLPLGPEPIDVEVGQVAGTIDLVVSSLSDGRP